MSRPSNRMRPSRGAGAPNTVIISVDLPAPLAPMSVTISPRLTSSETFFKAMMLP